LCGAPSIVLIDNVLAVGDIGFQQRCLDRVLALRDAGSTLIVAFSDEAFVQRLATRVITLGSGRVVEDVPPLHWLTRRQHGSAADVTWEVLQSLPENELMALRSVGVGSGPDGQLEVCAAFEPKVGALRCRPLLSVSTAGGRATVLFRSLFPDYVQARGPEILRFSVPVPTAMLPNGDYTIGFHLVSEDGDRVRAMKANDAVKLSIRRVADPVVETDRKPLLLPSFSWEVERLVEARG
jgi:hypothetical protein